MATLSKVDVELNFIKAILDTPCNMFLSWICSFSCRKPIWWQNLFLIINVSLWKIRWLAPIKNRLWHIWCGRECTCKNATCPYVFSTYRYDKDTEVCLHWQLHSRLYALPFFPFSHFMAKRCGKYGGLVASVSDSYRCGETKELKQSYKSP